MGAVNAFQQLMTIMERIAPIKPEVVESIDWDGAVKDMGLRMGVPAKYLKSEVDIKDDKDKREAAMAEQQRMAKAESMASSMEKGASAALKSTQAEQMGGPGGMG
jgi:hypothetical protein